jgi:hypothetical protein
MESRTGISMLTNTLTGDQLHTSKRIGELPFWYAAATVRHQSALSISKERCCVLFILLSFFGCRKAYDPPAITSPSSYLVVNAVIHNSPDSTIITLSRTVNLSAKTTNSPVTGCSLSIESDQNTIYPLKELGNGKYGIAGLSLDSTRKYRLRILAPGDQYLSDFVPVVNAPAVDSVGFDIKSNGIQVNVSTHDPKNATHYYRWDYRETWIFHSNYVSGYVSNGDTVIERKPSDQVYQCWGNDTSSTIVLASSAALSSDVIANTPVVSVASTSEKLGNKYSIIVREYGLTGDAYTFWKNLKASSESLGGIFDPQPSQINGNIHSLTHPTEPVIGYVSAGRVTSKRIFIADTQLPGWTATPAYTNCPLDSLYLQYYGPNATVPINQENLYFNINRGADLLYYQIPVEALFHISPITGATIIGHTGATPECVDCTLRGTNKQPSFWQ